MRRAILIAFSLAVVLFAAACGAEGVVSPAPVTVVGTLAAAPTAPPPSPGWRPGLYQDAQGNWRYINNPAQMWPPSL